MIEERVINWIRASWLVTRRRMQRLQQLSTLSLLQQIFQNYQIYHFQHPSLQWNYGGKRQIFLDGFWTNRWTKIMVNKDGDNNCDTTVLILYKCLPWDFIILEIFLPGPSVNISLCMNQGKANDSWGSCDSCSWAPPIRSRMRNISQQKHRLVVLVAGSCHAGPNYTQGFMD